MEQQRVHRARRAPARVGIIILLVALITGIHGQVFAGETDALVRSLLIPGLGQAHQGHYGRASVYASVAVVSGFGLLLSQVHYNTSVDKYNFQKRTYLGYEDALKNGQVINVEDIDQTYAEMDAAWNEAEDRLVWRNAFLVTFVATYAVNLVDVLISKPYKIDPDERLAIDVTRERFLVVKTINF
jgi:hypothetical protein